MSNNANWHFGHHERGSKQEIKLHGNGISALSSTFYIQGHLLTGEFYDLESITSPLRAVALVNGNCRLLNFIEVHF